MNKIIITLLLVLAGLKGFSQYPVQISGHIEGMKDHKVVKLFKVLEGKSVEIASSIPQNGYKFGFNFFPEYEGFYVVGLGNEGSPNNNFKFYFKPGDQLQLAIVFENGSITYRLEGNNNSQENKVLTQWHDLMFPLENKSINFMATNSTYVDYFPEQEVIMAKAKTFFNDKATGNHKFDKMMQEAMLLDMAMYATNFLNTPRSAHPEIEEYSPFYSTLKAQDFTKSSFPVYGHPYGIRTLDGLIRLNQRQDNIKPALGLEGLTQEFKYIQNDTLKGSMLLEMLGRMREVISYEEVLVPNEKYLLTDNQKKKNQELLVPLLDYKPGARAYQFSYPDINGKNVTMESLKGKVVLVDVWATWCGPCLAQVPSLKKLEEEFEGTDLQIVSISVDEDKDREKWKNMIAEKELGGIQLFASGWSEITRFYQIKGIPRFMVFDKQGKIVNVDAPRPSDPKLKELLLSELAKK